MFEVDDFQSLFERGNFKLKEQELYGSVFIDYNEIYDWNKGIAKRLIDEPDKVLEVMNRAAVVQAGFSGEISQATMRISDVPYFVTVRKISSRDFNKLISVRGIITSVAMIEPKVVIARYKCLDCGITNDVEVGRKEFELIPPVKCVGKCKRRKFKFREDMSEFIDSQWSNIQELQADIPTGQIPRIFRLLAFDDVVGIGSAGNIVTITGIIRVREKNKKQTFFDTYIEINNIVVEDKESLEIEISQEDEMEIRALAMGKDIHQKIINSIIPSIKGYREIKEGVSYLLVGGVKKEKPDLTIRGELNILIYGDPALAKSQILKGVAEKLASRAIYCSGRGSSAAGLTAAVIRRDDQWVLEAGALVLADRGVACIDEIDKMSKEDRNAIHVAMEQHVVPIHKAGINTTLNARTAVLAAANPTFGRYQTSRTMKENLSNLPVEIFSRFDLIFLLKDIPDKEADIEMARHVLGFESSKDDNQGIIPTAMLKKYFAYARRIRPTWTQEAISIIIDFYKGMRQKNQGNEDHPIQFTPRQLESLKRISEAHAKIGLKTNVDIDDAKAAIGIMKISLSQCGIDPETGELDIDVAMGIKSKSKRDKTTTAIDILIENQGTGVDGMDRDDWVNLMVEKGIPRNETDKLITSLLTNGIVYNPRDGNFRTSSRNL